MYCDKDKIWHLARFFIFFINFSIFLYSIFSPIYLKIIILVFYLSIYIVIFKFKRFLNLLFKSSFLIISIVFFKFFTSLFYGNLKTIDLSVDSNLLIIQILNILNSILFSSFLINFLPLKENDKIKNFKSLISQIKEIGIKSIVNINKEKIKINNLSSLFSYIIYESYLIFINNERSEEKSNL